MNELLEQRNKQKKRKPDFAIPDYHKRKEVRKRWHRPGGKHAKIRLHKRGHRKMPSQGYRSPKQVKGLNTEGLKGIVVRNTSEIKKIRDNKQEGMIIANVGKKKRISIIKEALAKGMLILNIKEPEEYEKRMEEEKKAKQAASRKQPAASGKKKEAKKEEKKTIEELTDDEKKKLDKKEKDKALIKREI